MCISSILVSEGAEEKHGENKEKGEEGRSLADGEAGKGLALKDDRE